MVFWAHQAELICLPQGECGHLCPEERLHHRHSIFLFNRKAMQQTKKKRHRIVGKQECSVGNFTPSWAGAHGRHLLAPQISYHPMLTPCYLSQHAKLHCRRTLWLKKSAWCFKCWGKSYKWKVKTFRILLGALGTGEGTREHSGFSASCGKCHG